MALRLTLKAHERVIISGAVIRNGDGRAEFIIENEVPVLRESDILSPSSVRTPCDRVYLALQLLYVDPKRSTEHHETLRGLVQEVLNAAPSCRPLLREIESLAAAGRLYQALKKAKTLRQHEGEILANVRQSARSI